MHIYAGAIPGPLIAMDDPADEPPHPGGLVAQAPPTPQIHTIANSTDCGVLASPNTCSNVP